MPEKRLGVHVYTRDDKVLYFVVPRVGIIFNEDGSLTIRKDSGDETTIPALNLSYIQVENIIGG